MARIASTAAVTSGACTSAPRRSAALVHAAGRRDQDRPAAGGGSRRDVAVGIADHPRRAGDRRRAPPPRRGACPGRACGIGISALAPAPSPRDGGNSTGSLPARPLRASAGRARAPGRPSEPLDRDDPLRGRRLVRDRYQQVARVPKAARGPAAAPGISATSSGSSGDSGSPESGSRTSSLTTPSRSKNAARRPIRDRLPVPLLDSAAPDETPARATRRPGTTLRAASAGRQAAPRSPPRPRPRRGRPPEPRRRRRPKCPALVRAPVR